jgi:Ca2+-binding RTX toxin-like protein
MRRLVTALSATAALLAPAAAQAETVRLQAGNIEMRAGGQEPNQAIVVQSGGNIRFSDSGAGVFMTADSDPGCHPDNANPGVICPIGAVKSINVDLGDADDSLIISLPAGGAPVTANGGSGTDVVQYPLAPGRVAVTLDGTANDGPLPGHDNIEPDFEAVRGGSRDDTLTAPATGGTLFGLRGRDHLNGSARDDLIDARDIDNCPYLGGNCPEPRDQDDPERDTVHCGAGKDTVDADAKDKVARDCELVIVDNVLVLSNKADRYQAYRAGLTIYGGGGKDHVTGSRGADDIRVRDGVRDVVKCGDGVDKVVADKKDRVAVDCENVSRR